MKLQSNTLLAPIGIAKISEITNIVDETLDVLRKEKKERSITVAQVWNIQRNRRSFKVRSFIRSI